MELCSFLEKLLSCARSQEMLPVCKITWILRIVGPVEHVCYRLVSNFHVLPSKLEHIDTIIELCGTSRLSLMLSDQMDEIVMVK